MKAVFLKCVCYMVVSNKCVLVQNKYLSLSVCDNSPSLCCNKRPTPRCVILPNPLIHATLPISNNVMIIVTLPHNIIQINWSFWGLE